MVLAACVYLLVVLEVSPAVVPAKDRQSEVAGMTSATAAASSEELLLLDPATVQAPRARRTLDVRIGPSENYAIVGLIPTEGSLQVVGRNEAADWIAIVFTPGSTFYGWVPVAGVSGLEDVRRLPVIPLTPVRSR
jgi:uncharacterized protein YraI